MTSYDLSRAAGQIKTSDVRDLLHYAQRADMISLAGGLPDVELMASRDGAQPPLPLWPPPGKHVCNMG